MARPESNLHATKHAGRRQSFGKDVHKSKSRTAKPDSVQTKLTINPRPDWHRSSPTTPAPAIIDVATSTVPPTIVQNVHDHANALLEAEATAYAATHLKISSSYKFMSTIMTSGTWSDKVSALTLVVQESPIHTLNTLENLIGLAGKRSRDQALLALGAIKDLFGQGDVLPSDRKLRHFAKQPGLLRGLKGVKTPKINVEQLPATLTKESLIFWAFEDRLKSLYFDVLKILETWCNDEVEFARTRALTFVFELLRDKPEQEENLLRMLVNKLGDTNKKISSRASHLLLQLQASHPSMKQIIIDAIEADILLRPGQSSHAKYYAIITLNQTVLQISDPDTANKLLDVYFSMFITILNRSQKQFEHNRKKVRTRKSSTAEPPTTKQTAPTKSTALLGKSEEELLEKITAQVLTGINRAFPFSKKDSETFEKHLDTMYRISHSSNFNTSIQALTLIQQISTTHSISTDRFMRTLYQSLLDPRLFNSSKQTMYLNLLYRSLKTDVSIRRIKAFVKRLMQVLSFHDPPFICAALYLVLELRKSHPSIRSMLDTPEAHDDLEDGPREDEDSGVATDAPRPDVSTLLAQNTIYDGRKREPEYSNAEQTCLWEVVPWLAHHHPSVSLFSSHVLASDSLIDSNSSAVSTSLRQKPLAAPDAQSHTLSHFLDRFAYRNPKTKAESHLRGQSIMQPALATSNTTDHLLTGGKHREGQLTRLNTEAFWRQQVGNVAEDEVFFHKYFDLANTDKRKKDADGKQQNKKRKAEPDMDIDEEGADVDEDWNEDEVWKAIVGSKGGDDVDLGDDDDIDGFESDDDDDMMADYADSDEGDNGVQLDSADVDMPDSHGSGVELGEGLDELNDLLQPDKDPIFEKPDRTRKSKEKKEKPEKPQRNKKAVAVNAPAAGGSPSSDGSEDLDLALDVDSDSSLVFNTDDDDDENSENELIEFDEDGDIDSSSVKKKTNKNGNTTTGSKKRKEMTVEDVKAFLEEQQRLANGSTRNSKTGNKRKKLKNLPTFASADDYESLLHNEFTGDGEDEMAD